MPRMSESEMEYLEYTDDDYLHYVHTIGYKEQEDALERLREVQESIERHKEYERIANIIGRV